MHSIQKKYYGYELEYYFQPGLWMEPESLMHLVNQLNYVNRSSGRNLSYGIFDPNDSFEKKQDFLKTINLCIVREKSEPVGFFYNMILRESSIPVIHAGLVMVAKNRGHDLIGYPYSVMTYLQYRRYGKHYYTNISSTPSIVGVFSDSFSGVWPSYKGNQIKPPSRAYHEVLGLLEDQYIKKYFHREALEIDKKRFVLRSSSSQMGFETDLKKLSRYRKPEVNYFCMFWLDYSKGEDLIQVGCVDLKAVLKIKIYYAIQKFKSIFAPAVPQTVGNHEPMKPEAIILKFEKRQKKAS